MNIKKLMKTQEDHSNPIPALNVGSLKVNLVVIHNTCSEKEENTYFVEYTGIEVKHFRDTLLQHMGNVKKSVAERIRHQRQYDRRVNKTQLQTQESKIDIGKALDADLVETKSIRTDSTVQDDNSRSGNDTYADDANIRPIYDEEPMVEVQLTAECNIFDIGQQHTDQPEITVEGRVDQYPETCQVKSHMLDSSPDNQTTKYSKQLLESENILLKKTVAQFQKDFSRMEAHCFQSNMTSAVYEKTSPRSDLRWKPTGRIFKSVGLRWIPTGKLFDSCTSKVDSDLHMPRTTMSTEVHQAAETVTTSNELDLLFGPLFDEYFNGENQVVLKSSAVTTTDASNKRQQQPDSTSSTSTLATTVTANGKLQIC
ncbi:hypothetical protein Tco_0970729 [Tanacetum coccineum]